MRTESSHRVRDKRHLHPPASFSSRYHQISSTFHHSPLPFSVMEDNQNSLSYSPRQSRSARASAPAPATGDPEQDSFEHHERIDQSSFPPHSQARNTTPRLQYSSTTTSSIRKQIQQSPSSNIATADRGRASGRSGTSGRREQSLFPAIPSHLPVLNLVRYDPRDARNPEILATFFDNLHMKPSWHPGSRSRTSSSHGRAPGKHKGEDRQPNSGAAVNRGEGDRIHDYTDGDKSDGGMTDLGSSGETRNTEVLAVEIISSDRERF